MGAVPMDGDVCTRAKVPELSLDTRKLALEQKSHSSFTHPTALACH